VPKKMSGRKRAAYWTGKIGAVSAELCEQVKRNRKKSAVPRLPQVPQCARFEGLVRYPMAAANALGQRGSKCVTAAPWKLPMMAWGTVCDDYFRVDDPDETTGLI
jgi:hypothetical protein